VHTGLDRVPRRELALFQSCGERVRIIEPFYCDDPEQVVLSDDVFINRNCQFEAHAPAVIRIGPLAQIGPGCTLLTTTHPLEAAERGIRGMRATHHDVTIGERAWLAAGVIVVPGVTIGAGSVVGAGAVVTKDIPPGVLAAGVPARIIRRL
jgi:maltose O-acetyltransferase